MEVQDVRVEAFDNPQFNVFDEGPAVKECAQQLSIVLKNVPDQIKEHAIRGMMEKFGEVTRVHVFKHPESNRNFVFVDFTCFAHASKARQEINTRKDSGFRIRAEFSRSQQQTEELPPPDMFLQQQFEDRRKKASENSSEIEAPHLPPPASIDLNQLHDGIEEIITHFEKKVDLSLFNKVQLEMCDKSSQISNGSFDSEGVFSYNDALARCHQKKCENCGKTALLQSSITMQTFCTIKCSKMEKESPVQLGKNEIPTGKPLQVGDKVQVVSLISAKILFIRRIVDDVVETVTQIFKSSKIAGNLQMFPDSGDLALAIIDKEVCRVRVVGVPEDESGEILVQLVDYGNTARVKFEDLLEMNPEVQAIKCTAIRVVLIDVNIAAINCYLSNYLLNLKKNQTELTVTKVIGDEVEITEGIATNTSVNKEIVKLAKVPEATLYDPERTSEYIELDLLLPGPNQKLVVINTKSIRDDDTVFCIRERNLKDFIEMHKAINHYANHYTGLSGLPKSEHGVYLAKVNDQWYRASVLKSIGDGKPKMALIDLNSPQVVSIKNVIPMPAVFAEYPVLGEPCRVEGYENIKKNSPELIQDMKIITVDEVTYDKKEDCVVLHFNAGSGKIKPKSR